VLENKSGNISETRKDRRKVTMDGLQELLSQERVKLRTSNFVRTFICQSEQKSMKTLGNSSRGRSVVRESRKFSGHSYMGRNAAHCAVIFAIAQLSCL